MADLFLPACLLAFVAILLLPYALIRKHIRRQLATAAAEKQPSMATSSEQLRSKRIVQKEAARAARAEKNPLLAQEAAAKQALLEKAKIAESAFSLQIYNTAKDQQVASQQKQQLQQSQRQAWLEKGRLLLHASRPVSVEEIPSAILEELLADNAVNGVLDEDAKLFIPIAAPQNKELLAFLRKKQICSLEDFTQHCQKVIG